MAILSQILSHWTHSFPYFNLSSDVFYKQAETIIKDHQMPDVKIERAKHKEGGIFSASREYLRIKRGDLVVDLCAAPFGRDFFISWWMYETESGMRNLLKFTKVGEFLSERAAKRTFYEADEEAMFKGCVHDCVIEAISKVTEGKGIRGLTDLEKQITTGGM
jgi:hypothetical protein